jgi:hypothetical protein
MGVPTQVYVFVGKNYIAESALIYLFIYLFTYLCVCHAIASNYG